MEKKKFIVIREKDLEKYSNINKPLIEILTDIYNGRNNDGKTIDDKFYVVNTLEPYANAVWDLIQVWELIKEREHNIGLEYEPTETKCRRLKREKEDTMGIAEFDIFKTD